MTPNDPLHYSTLKAVGLSSAHLRHAMTSATETTRGMRVGTVAHHVALGAHTGKRLVVFPDDARRGNAWKAFEANNAGCEIVTQPEWEEGEAIGRAVLADPVAAKLLAGCVREMPLTWDSGGVRRATHGIDFVNREAGYIGDLKTTTTAQPDRWSRLAFNMSYHVQLCDYAEAARQNGIEVREKYLLGVESSPPYAVTVFRLTEDVVALGRKTLALWLEKFRNARENDFWPGYTQTILDLELPAWVDDEEEDS